MVKNAQLIKGNSELVEVVKRYLPDLTRSGSNWKACCPFHDEKTPSFVVSPSRQIWTCFGCHRSGDVFEFIKEIDRVSFTEAVEEVAKATHQRVEYERGYDYKKAREVENKKRKEEDDLRALLEKALKHYEKKGWPDDEVVKLDTREYRGETLKKFQVLPGTDEKDFILKEAKKQGWNIAKLKKLGLVGEKDGRLWDFQRGRILFVLQDFSGRPVGIAGRATGDLKGKPKYINSPASALFNKGQTLYGYFQAFAEITSKDSAFLVEGYTDVLTCHEMGLKNTIATGGTALTDEQAIAISRIAKEVIVFRDGDDAGLKAACRDIEILLDNGVSVKVLICDENHDPDSQLRALSEGAKDVSRAIEGFLEKKQDALIWRVMLEWGEEMEAKAAAMHTAVKLLAKVKNISLREMYLRELTKSSTLGSVRKTLEQELNAYEKNLETPTKKQKRNLTIQQENDLLRYGTFVKDGAFWVEDKPGAYRRITNFTITPIFHIKDKYNPTRILQLKHTGGETDLVNITTDAFVSFQDFKKILSGLGKYRFEVGARNEDFLRVMAYTNDEMPSAYRISTMGRHVNKPFYTWCNGITTDAGEFYEVNEYGLVEYDNVQFLLPGFDSLFSDENMDNSEDSNDYIPLFRYHTGKCISLEQLTMRWYYAWKENALIGFCWYLSSLFRDHIYKCMTPPSFPLLYLFGKKGSGKSTMLWSLSYMFGQARKPFTLGESTFKSLFRRMMQVSNAVITADEYSKNLDEFWQRAIMGAYGGAGRDISDKNDRISTASTRVKAAFAYAGQDMPLYKGGALFSRSIILEFHYSQHSNESFQALQMLQEAERTGQLSRITSKLQRHRAEVERLFEVTLNDVLSDIKSNLIVDDVENRVLLNHSIPLAVFRILSEHEKFFSDKGEGFTYENILNATLKLIEMQSNSLSTSDEIGTFWKIVAFMLDNGVIRHYHDIIVQECTEVTRKKGRRESETLELGDLKQVVFLRLNNVHFNYEKQMSNVRREYLDESTLRYYMERHDSFLGVCPGKKFGKNTYSAYMFDATKLSVEFINSIETRKREPDEDGEHHDDGARGEDAPF